MIFVGEKHQHQPGQNPGLVRKGMGKCPKFHAVLPGLKWDQVEQECILLRQLKAAVGGVSYRNAAPQAAFEQRVFFGSYMQLHRTIF